MTQEQMDVLQSKIGEKASSQIKTAVEEAQATINAAIEKKTLTKEEFEKYQSGTAELVQKLEDIAKKQGSSLTELQQAMETGKGAKKSIAQALFDDHKELKEIHSRGYGSKRYIVRQDTSGNYFATPFDAEKAVLPYAHQTVGGTIPGGSDTFLPSVSTDISSASAILRMGGQGNIVSQYRNNPFLFDMVNTIPTAIGERLATWWEEKPRLGGSETVGEGERKPYTQYFYELKAAEYKKEATLISFSEEFSMDFERLQSEIINKGRIDVINSINSKILADVIALATPYDATGTPFEAGVPFANDFDALAAMAAQVDNATFGQGANAALMSTFKKYIMGIQKNDNASYLNRPEVLSGMSFLGNPEMDGDDVIVGDFKNYNVMLRGGLIVKVGYNEDDFARNKFSTVVEQYYYNYMPEIHKDSIVKGTTFADVKTAILQPA